MELVTLNKDQRPIAAVRADDDLVREVDAYVARLRTRAAELRAEADRCDALAAVSEPVPVVLVAAAVEDDPAASVIAIAQRALAGDEMSSDE